MGRGRKGEKAHLFAQKPVKEKEDVLGGTLFLV